MRAAKEVIPIYLHHCDYIPYSCLSLYVSTYNRRLFLGTSCADHEEYASRVGASSDFWIYQ